MRQYRTLPPSRRSTSPAPVAYAVGADISPLDLSPILRLDSGRVSVFVLCKSACHYIAHCHIVHIYLHGRLPVWPVTSQNNTSPRRLNSPSTTAGLLPRRLPPARMS